MSEFFALGCIGPLALICLFGLTFFGVIALVELRYFLIGRGMK